LTDISQKPEAILIRWPFLLFQKILLEPGENNKEKKVYAVRANSGRYTFLKFSILTICHKLLTGMSAKKTNNSTSYF